MSIRYSNSNIISLLLPICYIYFQRTKRKLLFFLDFLVQHERSIKIFPCQSNPVYTKEAFLLQYNYFVSVLLFRSLTTILIAFLNQFLHYSFLIIFIFFVSVFYPYVVTFAVLNMFCPQVHAHGSLF
jgi:hypothetical protein